MSGKRPTRSAVAFIYLKRALRWRRSNWPYISGDCFADLADYVYKPPRFRGKENEIARAKIIFCRSHDLQEMLDIYHSVISAKVIITGNSDFEFHDYPSNIPTSVRALFLQNSYISDNTKIYTIPIGIENFRLGVNGNPRLVRPRNKSMKIIPKILIGPLSPTHFARKNILETFPISSNNIDVLLTRLKPQQYNNLSKNYLAIAAIRGNGVDTHRLWESLYRGVVPVVQKDDWWNSISDLFPHVAEIRNWNLFEIGEILKSDLKTYFDPKEIKPLWMPYWKDKILTFL